MASSKVPLILAPLKRLTATQTETVLSKSQKLSQELAEAAPDRQAEILKQVLHRVVLTEEALTIEFSLSVLLEVLGTKRTSASNLVSITVPLQIKKRGIETKLILPGASSDASRTPDATLIKAIVRAHAWWEEIASGEAASMEAIAKRENVTQRYVSRLISLAFLSPSIVSNILNGQQPVDLTAAKLASMKLPLFWKQQEAMLGV